MWVKRVSCEMVSSMIMQWYKESGFRCWYIVLQAGHLAISTGGRGSTVAISAGDGRWMEGRWCRGRLSRSPLVIGDGQVPARACRNLRW